MQNQTDGDLKVDVAVRSANATFGAQTEDTHSAGVQVTVPANDRVEVRFPASPEGAGEARFQVVATSDGNTDAASFDFPVWTPATSEAFATYGVIDDGAVAQPIAAPDDAWPQFGGLEVTTSSTQLQALTDAVLYLNTYEFECSEQVASRITSVVPSLVATTWNRASPAPSGDAGKRTSTRSFAGTVTWTPAECVSSV